MTPALIGTKIGMTRIRDDAGVVTTVTVIQAGPCTVMQVRTPDKDGYHAVQMGYRDMKPNRSTKPLIGHAAKVGTGAKRVLREIRLAEASDVSGGDVLNVEIFDESVNYVDVTATSKGRGFTGVMKRHGFGGLCASHGVERKHRSGGSIGGHSNIGLGSSVKKGKKMAGHYGHSRVTVCSLRLMGIDSEHDLLLVKGSVPGPNGGVVFVARAKTRA